MPQPDSRPSQSHSSDNPLIAHLHANKGLALGNWPLLRHIPPDEVFKLPPIPAYIQDHVGIPYHDQEAAGYYFSDHLERCLSDPQAFAALGLGLQAFKTILEDPDMRTHVDAESVRVQRRRTAVQSALSLLPEAEKIALIQVLKERVARTSGQGMKVPLLKALDQIGIGTTVGPGENGYTKVFTGGIEYSLDEIETELMSRNESHSLVGNEINNNDQRFITIAISYRHFSETDGKRIGQQDLRAIADFIKASYECQLRFWIDSKLPVTQDSSFDRWLRRGVRPYCRYLTLLCPSAAVSTGRFWLENERAMASMGKGVFLCERNGIFFTKRAQDHQRLAARMLSILVGGRELPPGVRPEDEGKVAQWALGYFSDPDNMAYQAMSGPKLDEIRITDKDDEIFAMAHIAHVIQTHGEMSLPLLDGHRWNKENPLLKTCLRDQVFTLPSWVGLSSEQDRKIIYFVHFAQLSSLATAKTVALRIRLKRDHDVMGMNYVEEKLLGEFNSDSLLRLTGVTVPQFCEWETSQRL